DQLASRTRRDRPYLLVLAGSNVGERYRVDDPEIVVGRTSGVTIRLSDDGISRRHARLVRTPTNEVAIEDLQSSNGTFVNNQQINRAVLRDGDKIRIGSTTILMFTYQDQVEESFLERMYDRGIRDELTGAFNRKFFLDRLEAEIAYARRHNAPLAILLFDIDHFKRINDTYGHPTGDLVLARVAKLAGGTVRTEDVFARYGGEEFIVLCRGVPLENAGILAERLRALIEGSVFEHEGTRMPITVSIGVAALPEIPAETGLQLIAAADEALYEAKRTGRNRVLLKQGSGQPL
ncbi:MAG TPA: GGDEF domain-containing protein, partial [Candidatus Nanopelagicales bacterium]|nr:GGDEF domain-containing protein [Candidatus Nanopelagicales bacterium]